MCNHVRLHELKDGRRVPVPCGFCAVCRSQRVDEWQTRLEVELLCQELQGYGSTFLTLTHDDDHEIPFGEEKRFVQLFFKRVRKAISEGKAKGANRSFKYFLVSEYGDMHGRLHYHAIIAGLDYSLHARLFRDCWPHGFITSLPVRDGAVRYVLKYLEKCQGTQREQLAYLEQGKMPPFRLFSKGIGSDFFQRNQIVFKENGGYFVWHGRERLLPEYLRRKLGIHYVKQVFGVDVHAKVNNAMVSEDRLISRARNEAKPVYTFRQCDDLLGIRREESKEALALAFSVDSS